MNFHPVAGSCLCGAVRFEVVGPFTRAYYCHCGRCRKQSGSDYTVQGRLPRESLRLISGGDDVVALRPEGGFAKAFCGRCGSSLFGGQWPDGPDVSVRFGALEGDPGIRPDRHIFIESAPVWLARPEDGLPCYEGFGPAEAD
jgi:hypothetical protein